MVDIVVVSIEDSPWSVPTAKNGFNSSDQLFPRVCWRLKTGGILAHLLEIGNNVLELVSRQLVI